MTDELHTTQVTDEKYRSGSAIKIECSCGAMWVLPQPTPPDTIETFRIESTRWHHNSLQKPPIKPD